MQFGLFNLMTRMDSSVGIATILADTAKMVQLAEDVGFDVAWFAEHHFSNYSVSPSPLLMVSHCAARTRRIKLGPAVLVLPFYEPLRLTEEIALVHHLTDGRMVLGFGTGYQPYEFTRFGRSISERNHIAMEIWDIIEMGLSSGEVTYDGKYFQIPSTTISIPPREGGIKDIFIVSSDAEMIRRASERNYTPLMTPGWQDLEVASRFRQTIASAYLKPGQSDVDMPLGVQRYVYVTNDKAKARRAAECVQQVLFA